MKFNTVSILSIRHVSSLCDKKQKDFDDIHCDVWHIITTVGRCYYYLRLNEKPCLWVKGGFEDHRRRIYNRNIVEKIAEKLVRSTEYILHETNALLFSFTNTSFTV